MGKYILLCFIICIIVLVLFSTKSNISNKNQEKSHFYRIEKICPALFIINPYIPQINKELMMVNNWKYWPEKILYPDGSWKIIPLYAFGKWCKPYCNRLQTITYLLKQIPTLETALFSRMAPYTILEPHQGWATLSNRIIRCHLGIDIPGISYVAVGNERQYHKNGQWFAFDDSRMHYGCNLSSKTRTVLIVDIKRPVDIPMGVSEVETTDELIQFIKDIL